LVTDLPNSILKILVKV